MSSAATPSSGYLVAYDLDGMLKQKDQYGVVTLIATSSQTFGYKVYTANLIGPGYGLTSSPATQVLQNTLGFEPTFDWVSTGTFESVNASFDPNKCVVFANNTSGAPDRTVLSLVYGGPNRILLINYFNFNALVDGLFGITIEIRVYD